MTVAVLLPTIAADVGARALQSWADILNAVPIEARHVHEGYDAYLAARPDWNPLGSAADEAKGAAALLAYVAAQGLAPADLAASSILVRSRRLNAATNAFGSAFDFEQPFLHGSYLDALALEPISPLDFGLVNAQDDRQPNLALFVA